MSAVLAIDTVAFAIGTYIYVDSDRQTTGWFDERGVIATLDVLQLLVAAAAGMAAYSLFWRIPGASSKADAAGIFLWGIGGGGLLIFGIDDYFTIHEHLGDLLTSPLSLVPVATNSPDDLLVLTYAIAGVVTLLVFQMELRTHRTSTTLLHLAAVSSIIMVATDAFAFTTALKAMELPTQTLAASLLMFAFVTRFQEVRAALNEPRPPVLDNAATAVATELSAFERGG
jgi:hypothetical protein